MQRIGFPLLVTLITFSLGISCTRLAGFLSSPVDDMKPISLGAVLVKPQPGFRFIESSCESGCVDRYETSNGQQVFFTLACFSASPAQAYRDMKAFFEDGRVVHRTRQQDARGENERTVVFYPQDETGESPTKIFSYHRGESCFEYIEAGSLELALDFERSGIKDSW